MVTLTEASKTGRTVGIPVLKRITSEFWLAFVVAVIWAILRAWPFGADTSWGSVLANFGAAFFFVSYFTGQFVRIKRQSGMEQALSTVVDNQATMTSAFNKLANRLDEALAKGETASAASIAKEISQANEKLAEANNAVTAVLSLPWYSEWGLPPRAPPNPAIYESGSSFVPKPPDQS